MPIVTPPQSNSTSTAQAITTVQIFDYILNDSGLPAAGARVRCILVSSLAMAISPPVLLGPLELTTDTDANGYFSFNVIPNANINPANTVYRIETPFRQYRITVPGGGPYQTTSFGIIVDSVVTLAPAVSSVIGPLTITAGGLIVAAGGAHINDGLFVDTGTLTVASGGFTMPGPLTLTANASQIVPGATSFSVRDSANANDNLLVVDSGVVTARAGFALTSGLMTLPAASIADASLSGNVALLNAANVFSVLQTISGGGLAVTGGVTAVTGGVTVTAGNLTLTAGELIFAATTSKIVPGATSLSLRNNADNADNLSLTDVGLATLRNAVFVPPSAGAALPATSYGTLPVKLDEQTTASATSLTLTVPAGALYRSLELEITGRSDQASAQVIFVQFNADGGANYDYNTILDANATISGLAAGVGQTQGKVGAAVASGATAGAIAAYRVQILNADSTSLRKNWIFMGNRWDTDAAASANTEFGAGQWRNAANAITSVKVLVTTGNLITARAVLYGRP